MLSSVSGNQAPNASREHQALVGSRERSALLSVVSLSVLSLMSVATGLGAATRTDNVAVGGYYPGLVMGFGSFLAIIGINLNANKRPMLLAAIIFISFGVAAAFSCAVVDGVFAARHIDPRPVQAGHCVYYAGDGLYPFEEHSTEVQCPGTVGVCTLTVSSRTCYCCELYSCARPASVGAYPVFTGVSGCLEVVHLYRLLWTTTSLNVLGLMLGIVTAAILGDFKETLRGTVQGFPAPCGLPPPPPSVGATGGGGGGPPQQQQVITYTSYCTYPALTVTSSPGFPAASAPPANPDDRPGSVVDLQGISPSLLPNTPPLYTPMYFPASEKPPAYIP